MLNETRRRPDSSTSTRRALEAIGLPDVIESRQGFGYRLRITPVFVE